MLHGLGHTQHAKLAQSPAVGRVRGVVVVAAVPVMLVLVACTIVAVCC